MSCRSTAGGRAASACATIVVPGASGRIPTVLHALRNRPQPSAGPLPEPSIREVEDTLRRLAGSVRATPGVSPARRDRALERVEQAITAYRSGAEALPDADTVRAWADLPSALETENHMRYSPAGAPAETATLEFEPGQDSVHPYHKAFSRIIPAVKEHTDALFRSRPSRMSREAATAAFQGWLSKVSQEYGVATPVLIWDEDAVFAGGGEYRPQHQEIRMSKVSVTTLIHEFRHHLQSQGATMIHPDLEEDARAWSLSVYYAVRPELLRRLVSQGRVFHISAADFD